MSHSSAHRIARRIVAIVAVVGLGLLAMTAAGCGAGGPNEAYRSLRSAYLSGDSGNIAKTLTSSFKEQVEAKYGSLDEYLKTALPPISDLEPIVDKLLPEARKAAEAQVPKLEEELKKAEEAANQADNPNQKAAAKKRVEAIRRNLTWAREQLDNLDNDFFWRLAATSRYAMQNGDRSFAGLNVERALAFCPPEGEIGKLIDNIPQGRHGYRVEITLPDGTVVRVTAVEEGGDWKISWPVN